MPANNTKNTATASADSAPAAAAAAAARGQKITAQERSFMMLWLSKAENRNIITGAALLLLLCCVSPARQGVLAVSEQGGACHRESWLRPRNRGLR